MANLHFISGLPRSGSTLLSAILTQNPRFYASVTSPLVMLCSTMLNGMSGGTEFSSFFDDKRRIAVLNGLLDAFYPHREDVRCSFDTNRSWTARASLIEEIRPSSRIICCVREVAWIIDSLERLVRGNSLQPSRLFGFKAGGSVYSRVETLMDPDKGLIGLAWSSFREAWFSDQSNRLVVVPYERLAREPLAVINRLYEELEEKPFQHDFTSISFDATAYDSDLGLPGLHKVRPNVSFERRTSCLPPDIFSKYADVNFWLNPKLNTRGVKVL